MGRRTLVVAQIALLATSLAVVVVTSRASDWAPLSLVFLLDGARDPSATASAIETQQACG